MKNGVPRAPGGHARLGPSRRPTVGSITHSSLMWPPSRVVKRIQGIQLVLVLLTGLKTPVDDERHRAKERQIWIVGVKHCYTRSPRRTVRSSRISSSRTHIPSDRACPYPSPNHSGLASWPSRPFRLTRQSLPKLFPPDVLARGYFLTCQCTAVLRYRWNSESVYSSPLVGGRGVICTCSLLPNNRHASSG